MKCARNVKSIVETSFSFQRVNFSLDLFWVIHFTLVFEAFPMLSLGHWKVLNCQKQTWWKAVLEEMKKIRNKELEWSCLAGWRYRGMETERAPVLLCLPQHANKAFSKLRIILNIFGYSWLLPCIHFSWDSSGYNLQYLTSKQDTQLIKRKLYLFLQVTIWVKKSAVQ